MKVLILVCSVLLGLASAFLAPCQIGHVTIIDPKSKMELVSHHNCGSIVNTSSLLEEPTVKFNGSVTGHNYTLVLLSVNQTDQKTGTYLHWLVANIVASGTNLTITKNATVIAPYVPPAQNVTPGLYKYVFLIYAQKPGSYNPWRPISNQERSNFSVENWMNTYPASTFSLRPVGGSELLIKYHHPHHPVRPTVPWPWSSKVPSPATTPGKSGSGAIGFSGVLLVVSTAFALLR